MPCQARRRLALVLSRVAKVVQVTRDDGSTAVCFTLPSPGIVSGASAATLPVGSSCSSACRTPRPAAASSCAVPVSACRGASSIAATPIPEEPSPQQATGPPQPRPSPPRRLFTPSPRPLSEAAVVQVLQEAGGRLASGELIHVFEPLDDEGRKCACTPLQIRARRIVHPHMRPDDSPRAPWPVHDPHAAVASARAAFSGCFRPSSQARPRLSCPRATVRRWSC